MLALSKVLMSGTCAVGLMLSLGGRALAQDAQACTFEPWREYQGTQLYRHRPAPGAAADAYYYVTRRISIDADGAPNAYHPNDTGLDALGNAGFPNGGWQSVLVPDPANATRPFVQVGGPFAGFFVSSTALRDTNLPATDPSKYVDSTTVPYLVFPGAFFGIQGTGLMGDFGYAINLPTGDPTGFIVADVGLPNHPLGEVSIAMANELGGHDTSPRDGSGAPTGPFAYVVFPASTAQDPAGRWPVPDDTIRTRGYELLEQIGGVAAIRNCIAAHP
jgi:hypothetical protein